jgi:prolyl oligopeptidase
LVYTSGAKPEIVTLPFAGAVSQISADPLATGIVFRLTSWTKPPLIEECDGAGKVKDTGLAPPSLVDFSQIELREERAKDRPP